MAGTLAGRASVVTGGASGMGRATAHLFARERCSVIVTDVDEVAGAATASAIREEGGDAVFSPLDVTSEEQWTSFERRMREAGVTAMVHCAGIGSAVGGGPAGTEAYATLMDVNAFGSFLALRSAVAVMREGGGSIVTIASVTAVRALDSPELNVGYSASKSAVRMLTRAFARQEGRNGVRANCILPGFMTPMRGSRMPLDRGESPYIAQIPLGRTGIAEDVASAALFLVSDGARYITGIDLPVDGGYLA